MARIREFRGQNNRAEPGDAHPFRAEIQENCYSPRRGELTERQGVTPIEHDGDAVAFNDTPALTAVGAKFGTVGTEITFTAAASDDDTVRYFLGRGPEGANINESSGVFSWTPVAGQEGLHSIDVIACDDADPPKCTVETVEIWIPTEAQEVYIYRDFATSGQRADAYHLFVPIPRRPSQTDDTIRYAEYELKPHADSSVHNLTAIREVVPALNLEHDAGAGVTLTGSWSTSTLSDAYGGNATRSNTAGDTAEFTVSGHTLGVRGPRIVNGGFCLVAVDDDYTLANKARAVAASDFTNVTGAADDGGGDLRITAVGHGLSTNNVIYVENLGGITISSGPWTVTRIDDDTIDLESSDGNWSGSYTSGGTIGFFTQAHLTAGAKYLCFVYTSANLHDEWFPVAADLTDGSHTIKLTVLGTTNGNTGRTYVAAAGACAATTRLDDSGASAMWTTTFYDLILASAVSNCTIAPEFQPDSDQNGYRFMTGTHVGSDGGVTLDESETSLTIYVDGATDTLTADELVKAGRVDVVRVSNGTYDAVDCLDATVTFRAQFFEDRQLRVFGQTEWNRAGGVQDDYHGMLPLGVINENTNAKENREANVFKVGPLNVYNEGDFDGNDGTTYGNLAADRIECWHATRHDVHLAMQLSDYQTLNGADVFVQDRADLIDKGYFNRRVGATTRTINAGDVDLFQHDLQLFYVD